MIENQVIALISPALHPMGYDVVRVKMTDAGKRTTLQVMIERLDEKEITLQDCETVSYHISAILDVEDPIKQEYNLEVSSPGIDRPLVKLRDFDRFLGHEAKLSTQLPVQGRKNFRGEILRVDGHDIVLMLSDNKSEVVIPFNNLASAKLVLTDKLLKAADLKIKKE